MPWSHRALAVVVALLWGLNFLAIDASLHQFPPMFLVALRFAVIAVPTMMLVPRPQVPLRWLMGYGLGFGVVQFAFLYQAMRTGMPPGLASLVLQASAPFTVLLGAALIHERLRPIAAGGVGVAIVGLGIVGAHRLEHASLWPFLLTLVGALGWAGANLCSRLARPPKPLHLTLWMSVVPPLPMLAVSLLTEGPARIGSSFTGLGSRTGLLALAGLAYTVLLATVVGSGIWTWLMSRHPAGSVAPFSMLVPVFGMASAFLVLGERVAPLELLGGVLVVGGVLLASMPALRRRRA